MDNLQKSMEFCLMEYREKVEKQIKAETISKLKGLLKDTNPNMQQNMELIAYNKAIADAIKILEPEGIDLDEARVLAAVQMGFLER